LTQTALLLGGLFLFSFPIGKKIFTAKCAKHAKITDFLRDLSELGGSKKENL
jgi:hypothetical protein